MKTRLSSFGAPSIARQGPPCLQPAEQCSALRFVARSDAPCQLAFTALELLALLAALALLVAVALPALAGPRQRSERLVCASNLRQIGTGFQLWGNDHDDSTPQEVPVVNGGTRQHPLAPNAWLHFSWLSNELNSAALLFCPSDSGQPARDFTGDPTGGYVHPNFANRATSYFVAHVYNGAPGPPNSPLAGDRNVGWDGSGGCSRFNSAQFVNRQPLSGAFAWTTNLHGKSGNLLRLDGRVEQFSNAELRAAITPPLFEPGGSLHFVVPR
jgi:hypothetical protein